MRVAVVAPARTLPDAAAEAMMEVAQGPAFANVEISLHPQCFSSEGHFAGSDRERLDALLEVGRDPT
ncbi:MAG: LD-carboxypeptidase, partial [Pseudomonadota bacterium]